MHLTLSHEIANSLVRYNVTWTLESIWYNFTALFH